MWGCQGPHGDSAARFKHRAQVPLCTRNHCAIQPRERLPPDLAFPNEHTLMPPWNQTLKTTLSGLTLPAPPASPHPVPSTPRCTISEGLLMTDRLLSGSQGCFLPGVQTSQVHTCGTTGASKGRDFTKPHTKRLGHRSGSF